MAKISRKLYQQSLSNLQAVNGRRRERIISDEKFQRLVADAENLYKKESKDKYFKGVFALEKGTWNDKPNSYRYSASNTEVSILLVKGKKPEITVTERYWGYTPQSQQRLKVLYE